MEGPYQLAGTVIELLAGDPRPAVVLLRRVETTPEYAHYRGRLERTPPGESLAASLSRFVDSDYRVFWFEHAASHGAAFERQCRLWHDLGGPAGALDNACHPQPRAGDRDRRCPVCASPAAAGAA